MNWLADDAHAFRDALARLLQVLALTRPLTQGEKDYVFLMVCVTQQWHQQLYTQQLAHAQMLLRSQGAS